MGIFTLNIIGHYEFIGTTTAGQLYKNQEAATRTGLKKPFLKLTFVLFLLALFPLHQTAFAQNIYGIKGVVQDSSDAGGLPGVNIVDENRKVLAISDAQGKFSFRAAANTEVTFSLLGYRQIRRLIIKDEQNLTIKLPTSSTALKEVTITTALGIKREEKSLGYAATVVQGEQLTEAISSNWTDALSGKVAGVNLIRSNIGPGGSNKIILRGENNLTGDNEALIVVDGVVINNSSGRRTANASDVVYGVGSDNQPADYGSSLNDINPQDIESVTVLKGPSAAALYGQRGANGALIITTKSGSSKRKGFGVTFNSNASFESVNRWPDFQYEYGQGTGGAPFYSFGATADGTSTSGTSSAYGPKFDGQSFFQYDPVTQKAGTTRTPWVPYTNKIHHFFNTGKIFTNSVSVDGGTDKTTARFSAANLKNDWVTPNTGYERNTVALSVNSKVNDKLTIASKVNYINNTSDNMPGVGYGNQSLMYWFIFWQPSADPDWLRNYWKLGQEGRSIQYPFSSFPENPYAISYEFINKRTRNSITGNVQVNYDKYGYKIS